MTDESVSPTTVEVPGQMLATYEDGKISRWKFLPWGSYAGYFGPSARVEEGDFELDVEDTDGPFWRAVQTSSFDVTWEE